MEKVKAKKTQLQETKRRPALTPEARENQLISLAVDLAEKQLAEGTASSQVITHFLKLGSSRADLEKEKIKHENELLRAKTESLESATRTEELYKNAVAAFRSYSGMSREGEDTYDGSNY
jgi:hypothetical protein